MFKRASLALACACALALGACNVAAPAPTAAVPTPAAVVAAKTQTLAQVAGGDLTKGCATFNTAVGYYQDVAFLIPAPASTVASGVIVAGNLICALPSGNVASDLATLGKLWTQIQALTTVPKT
jgi:hypothetical protein